MSARKNCGGGEVPSGGETPLHRSLSDNESKSAERISRSSSGGEGRGEEAVASISPSVTQTAAQGAAVPPLGTSGGVGTEASKGLLSPALSSRGGEGDAPAAAEADATTPTGTLPPALRHFGQMLDHCYDFAEAAKAQGRPVVGIMCEFTPRELLLAAGGVPVCLCGGSAATIPPAEQYLPANLCPLIKSTFGYHVQGSNPFLKWADLVVAETTCDGKKKMFELMAQSKPMYVLELPQKSDDAAGLEHWVGEVRKFKEHLEARFQVSITDAKLREASTLMNRERALRRQLAGLMAQDPPPLTGRQLLEFKSIISGIEADLQQYEQALAWYAHATRNTQPATRNPQPATRPPVRVLLTGVPLVRGAERVLELIESCGATVVCLENCTGLKPILEDVDTSAPDPIRAIAQKYYHLPCSVMTPNEERFGTLRALAAQFRPDCVIELVWQACLTYDVESCRVRKLTEEALRLPYLKITTDYSPADSARIVSRVQALVETVREIP